MFSLKKCVIFRLLLYRGDMNDGLVQYSDDGILYDDLNTRHKKAQYRVPFSTVSNGKSGWGGVQ